MDGPVVCPSWNAQSIPFIGLAYFFSSLSLPPENCASKLPIMPICRCAARLGQPGKGALGASTRCNTFEYIVYHGVDRQALISQLWPAVPYRERAAEARTGVPGQGCLDEEGLGQICSVPRFWGFGQ